MVRRVLVLKFITKQCRMMKEVLKQKLDLMKKTYQISSRISIRSLKTRITWFASKWTKTYNSLDEEVLWNSIFSIWDKPLTSGNWRPNYGSTSTQEFQLTKLKNKILLSKLSMFRLLCQLWTCLTSCMISTHLASAPTVWQSIQPSSACFTWPMNRL